MPNWDGSSVSPTHLNHLVERGLLDPLTEAEEWIVPKGERRPTPLPGYVVIFMAYHLRGLEMPAHRFLRGMLHHYGVLLHALGPNGVQQMATYVALCEGFLVTQAHFHLFTYFFKASLVKTGGAVNLMGYCSIQRKQSRVLD